MTTNWPFDDLTLIGPDLMLRPVRDNEIGRFAELLPDDFDLDPTYPPLPELPPGNDRARRFAQSVWRHRGCWSVDDWALDFGIWRHDQPVGIQTLEGTDFPTERTVDTASWIAKPFRGKGFGIRARASVLAFAFEQLGAEQAVSSAVTTNQASLGVSRHLGYRDTGVRPHDTGDRIVDLQHLALSREDWAASDARISLEINGFDACRPFFGLR
ncbi:GNAT family N-acetyltransferase [Flexivirga sp. B27]